jgi:uncharacterized protein YndB with AHSA1/START domain
VAGRSITVERLVPAPPEEIFAILADPRKHPEIDGSGSVKRALTGPDRLSLGARFGMSMRLGVPYVIRNTVVEFEEGHRIGWRHFGGHVWRYELEPTQGGTLVRETFDWSKARSPHAVELMGFPKRNRKGMEATLDRLASRFAS